MDKNRHILIIIIIDIEAFKMKNRVMTWFIMIGLY